MKIKVFNISLLLILFVVMGIFSFKANEGSSAVENRLNQVIRNSDPSIIAKLSETEETKAFLMSVPENTEASRTSSSQGASIITTTEGLTLYKVYFVTTLNDKVIEVYMYEDRQSNFFYRLFPKWEIASIRV